MKKSNSSNLSFENENSFALKYEKKLLKILSALFCFALPLFANFSCAGYGELWQKAYGIFDSNAVFGGHYEPESTPYKVRVNFIGKQEYYFDAIYDWFNFGENARKAGIAIAKSAISANPKLSDFLSATKKLEATQIYLSHAVVCNFGFAEASEESFDKSQFVSDYLELISIFKNIKNTMPLDYKTKIVLLGIETNSSAKNASSVNKAIEEVALNCGVEFLDLVELAKKARAEFENLAKEKLNFPSSSNTKCSIKNCKFHKGNDESNFIMRKVAEEIFLSFYLDVEPIFTPNQNVATTPIWKWSKTPLTATAEIDGSGNQDYAKRNLIAKITEKGESFYPQVIFTGDSITDFFDGYPSEKFNSRDYWQSNIGYNQNEAGEIFIGEGEAKKYRAINLGNSGDFTQNLLYRWQNIADDNASGAYSGAENFKSSVKAISLLIGTNNIAPNKISSPILTDAFAKNQERPLSATETVSGQEAVLKMLAQKFPDAKILLMALYPRGDNSLKNQYIDFTRLQVMAINRILQNRYGENGTHKSDKIIFVDLYEKLLKPCGCQNMEYFVGFESSANGGDNIHLSPKGYQEIWWPTVKNIIDTKCDLKN